MEQVISSRAEVLTQAPAKVPADECHLGGIQPHVMQTRLSLRAAASPKTTPMPPFLSRTGRVKCFKQYLF